MRIVLAGDGSRGDLQPLIELGARLGAAGHEPRVCGPPDFVAQAADRGVPYRSVGPSTQAFLRERATVVEASTRGVFAEGLAYLRDHVAARLEQLVDACAGADRVVAAGAELGAASAAERLGIPYRYVVYCPALLPSGRHAPLFLPWQGLPRALNRCLWPPFLRLIDVAMRRALDPARARIGLGRAPALFGHLVGQRPVLAVDRGLAPAPLDLRVAVDQVPALHPLAGEPLPAKLDAFLASGPAPVYLGFGSMPDPDPGATTRLLLAAVERVGCRAVIGSGWAGLGDSALPGNVLAVDSVSHPALFARCAAVVHHGGAGTTTTAARAGAPQVVVPHLLDQFYWARRVRELGLGVDLNRRHLDAMALADCLEAVLDNELLAERVGERGAALRAEASAIDPVPTVLGS